MRDGTEDLARDFRAQGVAFHPMAWRASGAGRVRALTGTVPLGSVTLAALVLSGVFNGLINVMWTTFLPSLAPRAGRVFALIGTRASLCCWPA